MNELEFKYRTLVMAFGYETCDTETLNRMVMLYEDIPDLVSLVGDAPEGSLVTALDKEIER